MKLTPEQIEQNVETLRAWLEGREIQWMSNVKWIDAAPNGISLRTTTLLRLKPQPKLRPWTAEEVPVGALLRQIRYRDNPKAWVGIILARNQSCVISTPGDGLNEEDFDYCVATYEHSLDHGKTWLPCGVMEEAK